MDSKGVFVTFEGRLDTISDSQVFKQIQFLNSIGIEIDLFIFDPVYSNYKKTKDILENFEPNFNDKIFIFRAIRWRIPFSEILNSLYFLYCIKKIKRNYTFVHSRTDYATSVVGLLKYILKLEIIWDCRGDSYEEYLLRVQSYWRMKYLFYFYSYIVKFRMIFSRIICDNAIFVSEGLKKKLQTNNSPIKSSVIFNTSPSELFFFSQNLRHEYRSLLGYDKNSLVFIYSGSIVKYQSFEETLTLFNKLHLKFGNAKLLILTPQKKQTMNYIKAFNVKDCIIKSTKYEEVNNFLNAADIALMIREKNAVNKVASPTKYSEYCMAGLKIIMTDAVEQNYDISKKLLKNIIEYDLKNLPIDIKASNFKQRVEISELASKILSKDIMTYEYLKLYKTKY